MNETNLSENPGETSKSSASETSKHDEPTGEQPRDMSEASLPRACGASPREQGEPRVERTVEAAGRIVEAAVDIGRAWAACGLRLGKLALETHAHTMGKLAGALGEVDRSIRARAEADSTASDAGR